MNKKFVLRGLSIFVLVALLAGSFLMARPDQVHATFGDRITVSGTQFMAGANRVWINGGDTPWNNWNDFGGNYNATWWSDHFQQLHDQGLNATRVWIICSGEVGIVIDSTGNVTGATDAHWANLDSFFAIAQQKQIYIMATLMSFDSFKNTYTTYTQWRNWINSDTNINSYVTNYLIPFVNRYKSNPYLWSIDMMNEPDWVYENAEEGQIPWARMQSYFARASAAIHANSPILVTVGMGMPKYMSSSCSGCQGNVISDAALKAVAGDSNAHVDFYASHYYPWEDPYFGGIPFYKTPTDYFGSDPGKPALIGEEPANGSTGHALIDDYENGFQNGWQGVMPWTTNGVDGNGGFAQVTAATSQFRDNHVAVVFPGIVVTTGPTRTSSLTPTITKTPTITMTVDSRTNLAVQLKGNGTDNNQQTGFSYVITNNGTISVTNLQARIYFTPDGVNAISDYTLEKYYDGSGGATVGTPVQISSSIYYLPVNYGTASLAPGAQWEFQTNMHLISWGSTFNGANDWWHIGYAAAALPAAYTTTSYIPVFVSGGLAAGTMPGVTPQITNTPGPTSTVTKTSTITLTPTIIFTPTRTLTPATLTPTTGASPTRTFTVGPTFTRTLTPVFTLTPTRTFTTGPTATKTLTPVISLTPSPGASPTRTFTVAPTITQTQTTSACSPVTSTITAPFTYDGAGTFCWQSSNLGTYVNSWNTTSVSINGTSFTNVYVAAGSYPAKVNGYWYVSYNSALSYGHFETK